MQNTGVKLASDEPVLAFNKVGSIPTSHRSPEEREEDLGDNVMTWMQIVGP
jgi:hypothetical protein